MLIGDIPRASARRFANKTALVCEDRDLSFGALDAYADRFAAGLRARGLEAGDVVSLYGENGWGWAVAYYGIVRAGCVVNPVNAMLTAHEFGFIAQDCDARLVVASATKAASLGAIGRSLLIYGAGDWRDADTLEHLLEQPVIDALPSSMGPADLSTLCYTSGTTGKPKGAMLSHANVVTNVRMTTVMHGRSHNDIVVSALPCAHVYGNVVLNASMLCGATLCLYPRFEAAIIVAALEQRRATMFEGVPTMYHYLREEPTFVTADLSSLRLCTVGGQSMPVSAMAAVEAVTRCPLIELWGMTEVAGLGATNPHTGPYRHGSIGTPLPFVDLRIADPEDVEHTLATGETGELLVRGPIVMMGYLGHADATDEAVTKDGWLRTGDIAFCDNDGFFHVVDRRTDVILTAGYNIYPAELEIAIASHPAVAMVAVGPVPDVARGEAPRAYIVLKANHRATEEEILSHCRGHLARYKLPRSVVFVNDLPKTSTGKIMRRVLHQLDEIQR